MANKNLAAAKKAKNDEFYTTKNTIEAELGANLSYRKHFEGKTVLMNCDDPEWSEFWKFFVRYFHVFKLKKIISTHYNADGSPSYKLEWDGTMIGDQIVNMIKTPLEGNGDFASPECIALLEEADIIVTNPPFSIAREKFIPLLYEYKKQFLIIGDLNWITYKDIFPKLKNNEMWTGYTYIKEFKTPSGELKKFGNKLWFTNIDIAKRHEELDLNRRYDPEDYPKYDNYDAINVDKVADIPCDYYGAMGVPITFLDKYCPEQFEILNCNDLKNEKTPSKPHGLIKDKEAKIGDKITYARILIKKKNQ